MKCKYCEKEIHYNDESEEIICKNCHKSNELYFIIEIFFWGDKIEFVSNSKEEIANKLIECKAYKQPIMMDGGFILYYKNDRLSINQFVEKYSTILI